MTKATIPGSARNAITARRKRPFTAVGLLVAGRDDGRGLDHQDDGALGRPRPVQDALRHDEAFLRLEDDAALLEIDDEVALEHEEELVVVVVLVPVILALHDTETH